MNRSCGNTVEPIERAAADVHLEVGDGNESAPVSWTAINAEIAKWQETVASTSSKARKATSGGKVRQSSAEATPTGDDLTIKNAMTDTTIQQPHDDVAELSQDVHPLTNFRREAFAETQPSVRVPDSPLTDLVPNAPVLQQQLDPGQQAAQSF